MSKAIEVFSSQEKFADSDILAELLCTLS